MNLEEQVRLHKEISLKVDELEAEKKALTQSIMQSMPGNSLELGKYVVKKCSRLSITSSLEEARPYEAVKLEEVVDKDKLKKLYNSGQNMIPGIKEIRYIQVIVKKDPED